MWRRWRTFSSSTPSQDNHHHHHHHHHHYSKLGTLSSESPPPPHPSSPLFRCSSFKDIESLCLDSLNSSLPPCTTPRRSVYHRTRTAKALLSHFSPTSLPEPEPEPEPVITIYYSSLRVVRPTFEACRAVLSVLQGFRVAMDQRDVAMDAGFMLELRDRMGSQKSSHDLRLPRVFIGNQYIGGADEVLHLHEIGELKKMVQGLPVIPPGTCDMCGGYKFVMCAECHGSRKIYTEKTGFRLCTVCNENGLIRCPQCSCPSPPSHNNPSTVFCNASS